MHLKAVFFVRCSEQNIKLICQQLKEPVFSSYYLCKQGVRYVLVFKLYLCRLFKHGQQERDQPVGRSRQRKSQCGAADLRGIRRLSSSQQWPIWFGHPAKCKFEYYGKPAFPVDATRPKHACKARRWHPWRAHGNQISPADQVWWQLPSL